MSDLTEKLWPAFQAESREQLEALELALVRNDVAAADVNALFRHFHTLKGGCAMMGYGSMERIAHACEDLLDPVRKGAHPFSPELVDALLAGLDCLKGQLASIEQTRSDPPPAPELLARLQALLAEGAPPAVAAPPVATSRSEAADGGDEFSRVACECLGALAAAALIEAAPGREAKAALKQLRSAALAAEVPSVCALLDQFGDAAGESRLALFADLMERLVWLEQERATDAGTGAAAAVVRAALEPAYRALSESLAQRLAVHAGSIAPALLDDLDRLLVQSAAMALRPTLQVLRFVRQVLREMQRGNLVPGQEMLELLQVALLLPADLLPGLDEDAPYADMCAQLHERLAQEITRSLQGDGARERLEALQRDTGIAVAVLANLGSEALERLEAALARHECIVELEADLEAAADAGRRFVDWLAGAGTLIGNYTAGGRDPAGRAAGSTRLCFLAALPLPLEAIREQLKGFDARLGIALRPCGGALRETVAPAVPAAEPARAASAAAPVAANASAGTMRIDSTAVDAFVNRVGEMVTLRNMLAHALYRDDLAARKTRVQLMLRDQGEARTLTGAELAEIRALITSLDAQAEQLQQADMRIQGALSHLQEEVLALRVVPISLVFNRLPRVVRDLGQALGRQVHLALSGEEVRIDKGMVDVLVEPMIHLVRNAIDHGIEPAAARRAAGKPERATLSVSARQQGNTLLVEVADDGRGLDHARIRARALANGVVSESEAAGMGERELNQLIFLPGFSTAEHVTDVSGRGVGMDAVRTRVLQLGGQVEVKSTPGAGTTFTLRLPLSAAIQNVVLVEAGTRQLAIPERNVMEIVSLPAEALQTVQGQACCLLRGVTLPLYRLAVLLGNADGAAAAGATLEIVVMGDGVHRIGLVVERVLGRSEVFMRDVHPDLVRLPGVGGASVLGDGRVVIILDCEKLFDLAVRQAQTLRSLLRAS